MPHVIGILLTKTHNPSKSSYLSRDLPFPKKISHRELRLERWHWKDFMKRFWGKNPQRIIKANQLIPSSLRAIKDGENQNLIPDIHLHPMSHDCTHINGQIAQSWKSNPKCLILIPHILWESNTLYVAKTNFTKWIKKGKSIWQTSPYNKERFLPLVNVFQSVLKETKFPCFASTIFISTCFTQPSNQIKEKINFMWIF